MDDPAKHNLESTRDCDEWMRSRGPMSVVACHRRRTESMPDMLIQLPEREGMTRRLQHRGHCAR